MLSTVRNISGSDLVSDIVSRDYRTADIFSRFRIDYTVDSNGTLHDVCEEKGLNVVEVQLALDQAVQYSTVSSSLPFNKWKVEFLIDYIENVHHEYVKQKLPVIKDCIQKLLELDRKHQAELKKLQLVLDDISDALIPKLMNEEGSIFPYFKQVVSAWTKKESYGALLVKTLRKPYEKILVQEHKKLLELLQSIRKMTHNYDKGRKSSPAYAILLQHLCEFDSDTQQHIYLEDKVLFPKIMQIEKDLQAISFSLK